MARCENCGKSPVVGRTSKHHRGVASKKFAKKAPKKRKVFKPNIQKTTIKKDGKKFTLKLCARCMKKLRRDGIVYRGILLKKKDYAKDSSSGRSKTAKN